MPDRENPDAAIPLSGKAVRRRGRPGSWLYREAAAASLCALLGVTPVCAAAGSDDHRAQPNGRRLSVPAALSDVDPGRMLERVQDAPRLMQLYAVNGYFNAFGYRSDLELWELPDHWASPEEFLARRAGDCEDFAIAKYFALRALGVADDVLFIAYVLDRSIGATHMILVYRRPGAPDLVLDNRTPLIHSLIEHPDLVPIYGFNASGTFLMSALDSPRIRTHRRIAFFHPQWAGILRNAPGGDPLRPRAKGSMPAVFEAPGGL